MNILLNTLGLTYMSDLEFYLSLIGFFVFIFLLLVTKKTIRNEPEKLEPPGYQKDVLGQDLPAYHTFSGTFKPANKFNIRLVLSGLFLIIALVLFYKNAPERELETKNIASYSYVDPVNDANSLNYFHVSGKRIINLNKYSEFEHIFPQYPHQYTYPHLIFSIIIQIQ